MQTWVLVAIFVVPPGVIGPYLGLRHWPCSFPATIFGAIYGSAMATIGGSEVWPDAVLLAMAVFFAFRGYWALGYYLRLSRLARLGLSRIARLAGEGPVGFVDGVVFNIIAVVVLAVCIAIFA